MLTYAKIQIWKQFTTIGKFDTSFNSCAYLCKDTNLKAIHNYWFVVMSFLIVVLTYAKIQIWKQFTTTVPTFVISSKLCLPMQRYKFESNSQLYLRQQLTKSVVLTYAKIQIWKQFTTVHFSFSFVESCAYLCKDTNLKAIHNAYRQQ